MEELEDFLHEELAMECTRRNVRMAELYMS